MIFYWNNGSLIFHYPNVSCVHWAETAKYLSIHNIIMYTCRFVWTWHIVFLMDKSGSIGQTNFDIEKRFVVDLIEFFPVFLAKTRIAIVLYSTNIILEFNFKKYLNKKCTQNGIQNICMHPCGKPRCQISQFVSRSSIFHYSDGKDTYHTNYSFHCNSSSVVYLLSFKKCNKCYIGSTVTSFRKTFKNHKSSLNRYGKG